MIQTAQGTRYEEQGRDACFEREKMRNACLHKKTVTFPWKVAVLFLFPKSPEKELSELCLKYTAIQTKGNCAATFAFRFKARYPGSEHQLCTKLKGSILVE